MQRNIIIVKILIFINSAVFIFWNITSESSPFSIFITNNFLVSWDGVTNGYWWTLLSSVFSHNIFLHFFMNMFVLDSFGPVLEKILGPIRFLKVYLAAGVVGSLGHICVSHFILDKSDLPALGASGAIAGLIVLFSFTFPKRTILLFGLIPLPALWGAFLFIGLDIWGLIAQAEGGGLPIGHGAHLGGAFTGIAYYLYLQKNKRQSISNNI